MEKVYIGIDFGGTSIKGGIVTADGKILYKSSVPTDAKEGVKKVISNIVKLIRDLEAHNDDEIQGIGIGIPGLIDGENGVVVVAGNLYWSDVHIVDELHKYFDYPIKITNDANAAALGEAKFGSGKNYKTSVFVTLGTGIGGGIVIDGKLYEGNKSAGGEIGHMIIHPHGEQCTCGNKGCWETYGSATAIIRETRRAMQAHKDSEMWKVGGLENVDGKTAFDYADVDEYAKQVVDEYIDNLSIGLINIANIFRPEVIIIGGGVANQGDSLILPLREQVKGWLFARSSGPNVGIIFASLKSAGIVGAAALNM